VSKPLPNMSIFDLYIRAANAKEIVEDTNTFEDITETDSEEGFTAYLDYMRLRNAIDDRLKEVTA